MTSLVKREGSLLLSGGDLATDTDCCCAGGCVVYNFSGSEGSHNWGATIGVTCTSDNPGDCSHAGVLCDPDYEVFYTPVTSMSFVSVANSSGVGVVGNSRSSGRGITLAISSPANLSPDEYGIVGYIYRERISYGFLTSCIKTDHLREYITGASCTVFCDEEDGTCLFQSWGLVSATFRIMGELGSHAVVALRSDFVSLIIDGGSVCDSTRHKVAGFSGSGCTTGNFFGMAGSSLCGDNGVTHWAVKNPCISVSGITAPPGFTIDNS